MKIKLFFFPTFLVCILLTSSFGIANDFNVLFVDAARKVKQSVVNIIIYRTETRNGKKVYTKTGFGSGTIISKDGYVITNYHVVKKGDHYQLTLYDGTECELEEFPNGNYFVADQKTDLALLKMTEAGNIRYNPVRFGDSKLLKEGEWVLAVGNPYGLKQSITSGIISSIGRNNVGFTDIEDFIQTDVPINPGNSGGPLINLQGEIIGINTAIRTITGGFQGISFAIPSNIVKQVSYELMRYGRVKRGWLGFLAREQKLPGNAEKKIVEILSVIKNSPAEAAGIRKGDIIREINGSKIKNLGELVYKVSSISLGARIAITISRNGRLNTYSILVKEKEYFQRYADEKKQLFSLYGIELEENSRTDSIIISSISPIGIGYQYGLQKGDIVKSLNGREISNIQDFIRIFRNNKSTISRMEILRNDRFYTIGFTVDFQ